MRNFLMSPVRQMPLWACFENVAPPAHITRAHGRGVAFLVKNPGLSIVGTSALPSRHSIEQGYATSAVMNLARDTTKMRDLISDGSFEPDSYVRI